MSGSGAPKNADLLRDGEKVQGVDYQLHPGATSDVFVAPATGGGATVVPGRRGPEVVTFALPVGLQLPASHAWQLRDHVTGRVLNILPRDISNGIVQAVVQP